LLVAAGLHRVAVWYIRLPLLHRHYYYQISNVILLVGFFWLLFRVVGKLMQRFIARAIAAGRTGAGTLGVLGDRVLKLLVLLVAVFSILKALGFDLTTALAGVGIGGIAIAFAAQKTLENLFGGLSVLGDEVIRVGDDCRFGDRVGRVEDISLRSTRVRTLERTVLSIPNGSLATMNVENLSRRDKTLFNVRFSIRSETSSDQLRFLLAQVRRMLYEHPRVETESARIRFGDIEEGAFVLEIFAYILNPNPAEALAIREDLLLRITTIVEQSGTRFASPSRLIQVTRDSGLNKEKTESVVKTVEQWRDEKQLPFPDFSPEEKSSFRGSITYPGPDSSIGDHRG
jgi:MscS family membrane protein